MPPISSHNFKNPRRSQRKLVNEEVYTKGVQYTDNPLPEGFTRAIVNYIQKDYGERLRPRGGYQHVTTPIKLGTNLPEMYIHHIGTTFVTNTVTNAVFLRRYALVLSETTTVGIGSTQHSKLIIEEPYDPLNPDPENYRGKLLISSLKDGAIQYNIRHDERNGLVKIHDMFVAYPSPEGLHATIEGNTYLLLGGNDGLGRLHVYFDGTNYTHEVKWVTPRVLTPGMAVNHGYNLLATNPYTFSRNALGAMVITGVLPYNITTNKLNLTPQVGERVRFRMFYDYLTGENYKIKWEVQDANRETRDVLQTQQASPVYVGGADVYLDATIQYKSYSIIATAYKSTDLVNPLYVMIAAHYSKGEKSAVFEPNEYKPTTAKGVCVWQNQMVYWGVAGAEMSLFISEVNDPTYIPFPNNAVIFNEKILKAMPYMGELAVQTENTLYIVTYDSASASFVKKAVQAGMSLSEDDTSAIFAVRNLIAFKSKDYYYMVVPNVKNDKGELQIAPISTNISFLLDHFNTEVFSLLRDLYTLDVTTKIPLTNLMIQLFDYYVMQDGSRLRYVYKLLIRPKVGGSAEDFYYMDFHMVYDTILRSWTFETVESTRRPMHIFQAMSTGYAQFLSLFNANGNETWVQWLAIDEQDPVDNFNLDGQFERLFNNNQLLDTGKRDIDGNIRKRMRGVVVEINNLSDKDIEFHDLPYIDDEARGDLYKYTTTHVTDPNDPEYGRIYVERDLEDSVVVGRDVADKITFHGVTGLGSWSLGNSQFPEQTILKAYIGMTGNGYYPRLVLITRNSALHEINSISWVYRDKSAR